MRVVIAGAGIGGLTTALALHDKGIDVQVYEATREIRPLGVGINLLPHAMQALASLELLDDIAALGVPTAELCFFNRHGDLIWREPRGLAAGYPVPQISLHRGHLQRALLDALRARAGRDDVVVPGRAVHDFRTEESGRVRIELLDREGDAVVMEHGDVLVAADGIHSTARSRFHPGEGPPNWQGDVLWRGTSWAEPFLTGRSMFMAGHLPHKFVAYPISAPGDDGRCLVNWIAELDRREQGLTNREDWNRRGDLDDFLPHFRDWTFDWLDVPALIEAGDEVFEFPMVDRDPLPWWTSGHVTLLGDAAHPMFPIGSNGASQAILDAVVLADALSDAATSGVPIGDALAHYEAERRPRTAAIVLSNRQHGPERVLDLAEERAPGGFDDVADVFAPGELEEIAAAYKQTAGFVVPDQTPNTEGSG